MTIKFKGCDNFNQPLNDWNVSDECDTMKMFSDAPLFDYEENANWYYDLDVIEDFRNGVNNIINNMDNDEIDFLFSRLNSSSDDSSDGGSYDGSDNSSDDDCNDTVGL